MKKVSKSFTYINICEKSLKNSFSYINICDPSLETVSSCALKSFLLSIDFFKKKFMILENKFQNHRCSIKREEEGGRE